MFAQQVECLGWSALRGGDGAVGNGRAAQLLALVEDGDPLVPVPWPGGVLGLVCGGLGGVQSALDAGVRAGLRRPDLMGGLGFVDVPGPSCDTADGLDAGGEPTVDEKAERQGCGRGVRDGVVGLGVDQPEGVE